MDNELVVSNEEKIKDEEILIPETNYQEKIDGFTRLKGLFRRRPINRISTLRMRRMRHRCSVSLPVNPVYLQLLNRTIREISADVDLGIMRSILKGSIINGDMWSSLEKERFFKSLSRRSRHNPEDISRDVGSKSVMQVIAYMNILDEESKILRLFSKRRGEEVVDFRHIPAAMEMSDEWISIEEQEARRAQEWADKIQEKQEKLMWGPEWSFFENKKSNEIEMAWNYANETFPSIQEPLFKVSPEICLLRPKSFIELSEKLFFNKNIEFSKEVVLYRTTLMHMYDLVRRLTKRLVQTAHFIALSRLRAESSSNFHSHYVVRSKDVLVAVDILGVNRNSDEYWLNFPRRTKITVLNKSGQKLDSDVIENELSKIPLSILRKRARVYLYDQFSSKKNNYIYSENNSSVTCFVSNGSQTSDNENVVADINESRSFLLNDQENIFSSSNDDDLSSVILEDSDDDETEDMLTKMEDEFLEALDARKSAINERELWRKLSYFHKSGKRSTFLSNWL